jgi:hypothetical protein
MVRCFVLLLYFGVMCGLPNDQGVSVLSGVHVYQSVLRCDLDQNYIFLASHSYFIMTHAFTVLKFHKQRIGY